MNSWEKLPIGEIFSLEKGSLQSTKCTPGDYTFITASSEWKTHNVFSHDCEALIYAVAASGSLGRCHHYSGKFITSDLCFILRAKDEMKRPINYRFYQNVFRFLKDDIVAKTKAGTSKESISQKRFSAYTLPYIDIEHQSYWENKLNNLNINIEYFEEESASQSSYLTKLRQAILQEAIEGKLTADWRKVNPVRKGDPDYDAEALLEKIQAEKEKLLKEDKIKKQKPLAPIKLEEVPFELPEGWIWTRFQDITTIITDGKHGDCQDQQNSGFFFLSAKDIQNEELIYDFARQINKQEFDEVHRRTNLSPGDICMVNTGATVGKLAIAPNDERTMNTTFQKSVAVIKLLQHLTLNRYIKIFLNFDIKELMKKSWGSAINNLLLGDLKAKLIPLPSFAEQHAIVDCVEKLLSMVDEMEEQVSERKEQSEQLMQAVLREAFEGGK